MIGIAVNDRNQRRKICFYLDRSFEIPSAVEELWTRENSVVFVDNDDLLLVVVKRNCVMVEKVRLGRAERSQ